MVAAMTPDEGGFPMSITVRQVHKHFGSFAALNGVDLEVPEGELVALLGPSGSGKTTLLRVIAGLEQPDAGQILFHGEDATDVHVRERKVGFVFQHYALFRHMTVFENIAFGLRVRPRRERPRESEIRARVQKLLELVQLEWLADRYPSQLSGGQRQRIALARALAVEPKVLLLDEPFGALDAQVRKDLRRWLRRLHDEIHVTSVFVTHDQEEALEVADRVVVMNRGNIEQIGTPEEVYDHPATPFVYQFLGHVNLFHGRVARGKAHIGALEIAAPEHAETEDSAAVAYVRPHEWEVLGQPAADALEAQVEEVSIVGPTVRVELTARASGTPVSVELDKERYRQLRLIRGSTSYLRPLNTRVFVDDLQNQQTA